MAGGRRDPKGIAGTPPARPEGTAAFPLRDLPLPTQARRPAMRHGSAAVGSMELLTFLKACAVIEARRIETGQPVDPLASAGAGEGNRTLVLSRVRIAPHGATLP